MLISNPHDYHDGHVEVDIEIKYQSSHGYEHVKTNIKQVTNFIDNNNAKAMVYFIRK